MLDSKELSGDLSLLKDEKWRLSHLYKIRDSDGIERIFNPNWAQKELFEGMHSQNIILKARQLGITTAVSIYLLDKVLWHKNVHAGIIAHTLDDAQNIFRDKLKFTFDNLHPVIKDLFETVGDSAKELAFSHGSVIRVGTSLRGSTLQYLHISEFGKICAKYPERAREIITGSLNTVHVGQKIFIESTAEGREGYFFQLCNKYQNTEPRNSLDFKFFFFPWHKHPSYKLEADSVSSKNKIPAELNEYFENLRLKDIELSDAQKHWYSKKKETQNDDMMREFPSTPDEAFATSLEGKWYSKQLNSLYEEGHITRVSYDRGLPVYTAWDLGQNDPMSIWFFQLPPGGDINIIDYFSSPDTELDVIKQIFISKKYAYDLCIWPHDAKARGRGGITFQSQAQKLGFDGLVLEAHGLRDGINKVRTTLGRCWFDKTKTKDGLDCLENYKKRWSTSIGGWTSEPVHDKYSHGADAFRYLCAGIDLLRNQKNFDAAALRSFWGD